MSSITGETGAGKSILIGGLALVLGKRADLSSLKDSTKKCFVDATFSLRDYDLNHFFDKHDLDYSPITSIRREIVPSGKSRAFINDTPVTLDILQALGDQLIDVHSQHQTLSLTQEDYQLEVLDALAGNGSILGEYQDLLMAFKAVQKEYTQLKAQQSQLVQEQDYNQFLLEELNRIDFRPNMMRELEEESQTLSNVEALQQQLGSVHQHFYNEQMGVLEQLNSMRFALGKTVGYGTLYEALSERMDSLVIEMNDLAQEIEQVSEQIEANPARLEEVDAVLHQLQHLLQKHQAGSVEELQNRRDELAQKVTDTQGMEERLLALDQEGNRLKSQLQSHAEKLHNNRVMAIPQLTTQLTQILHHLGMPNARFELNLEPIDQFNSNGNERLHFGFSANAGTGFGALKKVASGGELSRIMLAIKAILSEYKTLPTIIFDEIDTGVSGEVGNKIAEIMRGMSQYMQVITITHLPQVAAKGKHHYKVFKFDEGGTTTSQVKKLSMEERTTEIAQMLGGNTMSEAALIHAKELLN